MNRLAAWLGVLLAVAMLLPLGTAADATAQPVPDQPSRMRLDIDSLSPRLLTKDSTSVTVTGRVTNTGDRRIDDIRVQLLRGEPLDTEQKLRGATTAPPDTARSPFVAVSDALDPGQSAPVALTVPVRGGDTSLKIDSPGVYQLLVNINGRPEYGGRARLTAVSVLLPVLSVPDGSGSGTATPPAGPTGITMLWPLIDDHPRLVPSPDDHPLLSDDGLARSLSPGGRLYGLVSTATRAGTADPDLLDALCFAVDPDLLDTARQMSTGYRYRTGDGGTAEGTGAAAAKTWLADLEALTTGRCVIAVPYADTDLVALSRAGAVDLQKPALNSAAVVNDLLKPAGLPGTVLWPAGGTLDQRTLLDLAGSTPTTVLADPAHLHNRQGAAPYRVGNTSGTGAIQALPVDTLVSTYLDDAGSSISAATTSTTPGEEHPVSVQNGLAALAFQAAFAGPGSAGRPSALITPPRRWAAPVAELSVFLQALGQMIDADLARPQPLAELVSAAPRGSTSGLDYTAQDSAAEIAPGASAEVVRINNAHRDLVGAMRIDDTYQVDPNTLFIPLQYGLLRATSTAWRGHEQQANRAVDEVATQLDALRAQVTVSNGGRPLTLASGHSPIPVLLSNTLPVAVVVRVRLADTPGLRPESVPDVLIPARSRVNPLVAAEVIRSGRFSLDVSLSTPAGTPLGSTARLELSSTTQGSVTLILTGGAAAVLLLLVGLRLVRRFRTGWTGAVPGGPPAEGGAS